MLQPITNENPEVLAELALGERRSDALLARRLRQVEQERAQRSAKLAHARWMRIMLGEPLS